MKKLAALILFLTLSAPAYPQDYDPQHTMLALNMAIVSVHRIITTQSKAVLEQEYSNIINNLSLGNIESDPEMTGLYREMLGIISRKRISEGDSRRLKSYYDTAEQRRITYALSNIRMTEARIKSAQHEVSGLENEARSQEKLAQSQLDGIRSDITRISRAQDAITYSWLGNMAVSCVSIFTGNVFAVGNILWDSAEAYVEHEMLSEKREHAEASYRRTQAEQEAMRARNARLTQQARDNLEQERLRLSRLQEEVKSDEAMLKEELKASMWKLERQDIANCNALQQRLLESSWNLLRKYSLPDNYRLTQNTLKNFYRAVEEEDTSRRSRMLRNLEDEFRVYPPYWFYRARTAQESGNFQEAKKFYAEFRKVWRPVLRRDPYMIEAAKFRIQEIISEGRPLDEVRPEILEHLETVYDNTPKEDWSDNLFLGVAYFLLGDKGKGMDCIAVNLDFGYEEKVSGMLFAQMETGALDSEEAQDVIHRMKLSELAEAMNIADGNSAVAMALYFEGNADALGKMAVSSDNPVVFHALRLLEQSKGSAGNYSRIMEYVKRHEALSDKIEGAYSEIVPLVRKYADEGREAAKIFLADMLLYGLGIEQDTEKAEGIFTELAGKGNLYAQFVMVQSHLVPVKPAKKTLTPSEAEKAYQMGENYYYGRGVAQDRKKAAEYYLQAAEAGHAKAQYSLGVCYRMGLGVSQDLQKGSRMVREGDGSGA